MGLGTSLLPPNPSLWTDKDCGTQDFPTLGMLINNAAPPNDNILGLGTTSLLRGLRLRPSYLTGHFPPPTWARLMPEDMDTPTCQQVLLDRASLHGHGPYMCLCLGLPSNGKQERQDLPSRFLVSKTTWL